MCLVGLACLLSPPGIVPVACAAWISVELITSLPIYPDTDLSITVRVKNDRESEIRVFSVSLWFDWGTTLLFEAQGDLKIISGSSHEDFSFTVHVPTDIATDRRHTATVVVHAKVPSYEGGETDAAPQWDFTIPVSKPIPTTITATHPTVYTTSMLGVTIAYPGIPPPTTPSTEPTTSDHLSAYIPILFIIFVVAMGALAVLLPRSRKELTPRE
jgi:hypothetical protein